MPSQATSSQLQQLASSLGFKGPYAKKVWLACILSSAGAILGLAPHAMLAWLVSTYAVNQGRFEPDTPLVAGGLLGVILLARFLLRSCASGMAHSVAFHTMRDIRMDMADKLVNLPLGFIIRTGTGRVKKMLVEDVEQLETFIAHHFVEFSAGVVMPFATLLLLLVIDYRMALAAFLVIPVSFFIQSAASRGHTDLTRQHHDTQEDLNRRTIEFIRGMPEVKAFVGSNERMKNLSDAISGYQRFVEAWMSRWYLPRSGFTALLETPLLLTLPLGLWLYSQDSIELGPLVFCLLICSEFTAPLFKVMPQIETLLRILEGYMRIQSLKAEPELPEPASPRVPDAFDITLENVCFVYENNQPVLRDVSFNVPAGKVTALVGLSGSGKSTLLRLIPRFWDVREGRLLIGGVDVRDMERDELMRKVSFMFQDSFLFQDTIAANIGMGENEASDEDVRKAAHAACCDGIVAGQIKGYATEVGELGARFSGGERQRIALARTLLKPAPILLLDEATAFADPLTEKRLRQTINERTGQTVLIVAHRLQSIVTADQIVVLDHGRVIASGTHAELLAGSPEYAAIWELSLSTENWKMRGDATWS